MAKPNFLDLFSGTHSVGNAAESLGYSVTSLDLHHKTADIVEDIMTWDYTRYPPGHFDVVWASVPCVTFSKLRFLMIGRHGYTRESLKRDLNQIGLPLLRRTQEIIEHLKPRLWFIENPQTGKMKIYLTLPHYDVDYCQYGFDVRKRTRIWTNKQGFRPKLCGKACAAKIDGRHISQVNSTGGGNSRQGRYRVPTQLVVDLIEA